MAPIALEPENHTRDAEFNKAMHGKSVTSKGGFASMLNKDRVAHKFATDDYWKHWDNKDAATETEEVRQVGVSRHLPHYVCSDGYSRPGEQNTLP